jgi:hypothetical protein
MGNSWVCYMDIPAASECFGFAAYQVLFAFHLLAKGKRKRKGNTTICMIPGTKPYFPHG